jgi:7-cyano-7-deazaguanine synthase
VKALLLSGGMDSIALANWLKPDLALTIDYGQIPAEAELRSAKAVCEHLSIAHRIIRIDCTSLGSGDLAGTKALPLAPIPEWWPYRNQLLVTLAASEAIKLGVKTLILGCVKTDSCHQDGTPEFIKLLSSLLEMQEGKIRLDAPAIHLTSEELVRKSGISREVLAWAHSCHTANFACGDCRGCAKHYHTLGALYGTPY